MQDEKGQVEKGQVEKGEGEKGRQGEKGREGFREGASEGKRSPRQACAPIHLRIVKILENIQLPLSTAEKLDFKN